LVLSSYHLIIFLLYFMSLFFFFFFSSRRRHTRSLRDWSSDVCSSDLFGIRGKLENYDRVDQVLDELVASIPEGEVQRKLEAKQIFKDLKERVLREEVLTHGVRLDGRKFDEVRANWIETGVVPRTHGSARFTRSGT